MPNPKVKMQAELEAKFKWKYDKKLAEMKAEFAELLAQAKARYLVQLDIALPELYKKLFVACHDAAYKANALHWIGEVWVCDEYDKQGLAEFCEQELGYEYNDDECPLDDDELEDYDEEEAELNARDIHLQSWLEDYLQSADIETLQTIYLDYLGFDECVFDMEQDAYCVVIPDEIVKMAKLS